MDLLGRIFTLSTAYDYLRTANCVCLSCPPSIGREPNLGAYDRSNLFMGKNTLFHRPSQAKNYRLGAFNTKSIVRRRG